MTKADTKLTHIGLAPKEFEGVVNMPVCRASTILFPSLADFEAGERGEYPLPTYGRYGNPTSRTLEKALAELEGADHSIVFSAGMAAIATAILAFVKNGDHILMVDNTYAPTRRFCDRELKKFGVDVTYYNPTASAEEIAALMKGNTTVLYLESPGSLTFEVQDIGALTAEAKKRGIIVVADNTWATPLYFNAFEHGIDISMHSATKYICGHSDVLMGVLSCKKEHYKNLITTAKNLGGGSTNADDCYFALRGLRTMALRLRQHQQSALKVAKWLKTRDEVVEVYYPALEGAPGHELWKKYYSGACGLFAFQLRDGISRDQLASFVDNLKYFGMGFSWGGFESLIIPCRLGAIRTASDWPHDGPLMRIHVGLEDADDLIADIEAGFKRMHG